MQKFYERLETADLKDDARFAQLAKVCKADLNVVQLDESLSPWAWWTEE